jgi:hypothetical protein
MSEVRILERAEAAVILNWVSDCGTGNVREVAERRAADLPFHESPVDPNRLRRHIW